MFGAIIRAIKDAFNWIVEQLLAGVDALVQTIFDAVPGLEPIALAPFAQGIDVANQFVPLDLLFVYLTAYLLFVLGFALTKIGVKLIPFGIG